MKERKNERKNRKTTESTLQHHDEWRSDVAIAGVGTVTYADHDDVLEVGVAA
jgi:hypothetical protein